MTSAQVQWRMPVSNMQQTLFRRPTSQFLALLRSSVDDVRRWASHGWVSFDIEEVGQLDEPLCHELEFVQDITSHGLSDDQISKLLCPLPKPFRFDPGLIAYSFSDGWVQPHQKPTVAEINGMMKTVFPGWLRDAPHDRLDSLFNQIVDMCVKYREGLIFDIVRETTFPAPWGRPSKLTDESTISEDVLRMLDVGKAIDLTKGWLSFGLDAVSQLNTRTWNELWFVHSIATSLLTDPQVDAFLSLLPKPYRYPPHEVAFSFRYGWVAPPPMLDESYLETIIDAYIDDWLFDLAKSGQMSTLRSMNSMVLERLETDE